MKKLNSPDAQGSALLSPAEARNLILEINTSAAGIRQKLSRLHDGEGWRALGYGTWSECVEAEFTFGRSYAHRLLEAAAVERRLPIGDGSLPESHARELARVPADRQREVYRTATRLAGEGKVTASLIASVAETMGLTRERWGKRAAASNQKDYYEALTKMNPRQCMMVLVTVLDCVPLRRLIEAVDEARYATDAEQNTAIRRRMAGLMERAAG